MIENTPSAFWKRHLDKLGVAGTTFTALCCLGFPALLSVLSAVGLGFLINDAILLPLLVVFLAVTLAGLWSGMRHHRSRLAFVVGFASAAALLVFIFVSFDPVLASISIAGLVVASSLNVWLRARQLTERSPNAPQRP